MTGKRRLSLCLTFMRGNLKFYSGAILSTIITVLVGFLTPLVIGFTVDSVLGDRPINLPGFLMSIINNLGGKEYLVRNIWVCGLALVIVSTLSGTFDFLKGKWTANASESIARSIRNRLYGHLARLSYNYHVKAETGDLIQRCTSDVETIRRFLSMQLVEVFRAIFMLCTALFIMLPMHVPLTLVSLSLTPFIVAFSAVFFKLNMKRFREADEAEGAMSSTLQENLTGVRVVRAFGKQSYEVDKFDEKSTTFRNLSRRVVQLFATFWGFSDFMCMMQTAMTLFFGIYLAVDGTITLGTLTVFLSYVSMLLWPVRQLGRILSDFGKSLVSLDRIDEILREKPEVDEEDAITPSIRGDVEFDDVFFEYEDNHPILDHVSFKVKQGQTVAILGATGSGKSTLVGLLQRLYDVKGGCIKIGGVDVRKIQKSHLRSRVGIVLQEPFLYSKTIFENIGIAKQGLHEEDIFAAARTAHADGFIREAEKGYETIVGERGVTLSGGQKQRVAIARTLIKDNDILIFDDSLSAVDTHTDSAIRKSLRERKEKLTTFIISHRITTLQEADFILVLERGKITQQGSHEELIAKEGLYQNIHRIQTSLEEELSQVV